MIKNIITIIEDKKTKECRYTSDTKAVGIKSNMLIPSITHMENDSEKTINSSIFSCCILRQIGITPIKVERPAKREIIMGKQLFMINHMINKPNITTY